MANKKILLVIYQNKLGGAEKQAILYAASINRLPGYVAEIIYCLEEHDELFNQYIREFGIKATFIPPYNIGARNFLPRLYYIAKIRRIKPYGLISFTTMPNLFTGLIWKSTGAKFFLWDQLDVLPLPDYIDRQYFNSAYNHASGAIVNAKHIAGYLKDTFRADHKIHFIPNAVEVEPAPPADISFNEQYGIDKGSFIITMLANLQSNKDHLTVLNALLLIPDRYQVHIVFIGYLGGNTAAIINFINRNGLRSRVTLTGQVPAVSSVLDHTNLLIHSSRSEGMSVAVLEAVLADIPVVPSSIPGNREIFGEGYGYYFEVANADSLAGAIMKAIDNYPSLKEFAGNLSKQVKPLYSIGNMESELGKMLQQY